VWKMEVGGKPNLAVTPLTTQLARLFAFMPASNFLRTTPYSPSCCGSKYLGFAPRLFGIFNVFS
jgi:hypothetical protein